MGASARAGLALLLVLGLAGCASRTAPRPARLPTLVRQVLPNGVRIVAERLPAAPVVAVQLWVRAGSRDEPATQLGLAHSLEHMLFRGTTARPAGFIDREVEGVGGRINAGTSLDYTYYHAILPAARMASGIDMLADIAVNATLDDEVLERERRVLLEEIRRAEDDPRGSLGRHVWAAAFPGHPYGRPVLGTADHVRGETREALVGFYRHFYVPESFTLVVVGDVEPVDAIAAAARAFGRLPRTGFERLPAPPPPSPAARTVQLTRAGSHAYLTVGWLAPKLDHADTPAVDLLAWILGQGRASRLTLALRDRLGLVNTATVHYSPLQAAGLLTILTELPPANVQRVEAEILREVRRVRNERVGEAEQRRAVTAVVAHHEFSMETAEGRAWALGRAESTWRIEEEEAYVDRIRGVTAEQIRAAARRYLDPARYVRAVLVPSAAR